MTWDPRRAEDFFALKNPTASAGFEPANLGTKGIPTLIIVVLSVTLKGLG
jgi:hypothetical protein